MQSFVYDAIRMAKNKSETGFRLPWISRLALIAVGAFVAVLGGFAEMTQPGFFKELAEAAFKNS